MLLGMWKSQRRVLAFTVVVALFCLTGPALSQGAPPEGDVPQDYADTDPSAVEVFREELAPHGVWVEDPAYGLVWVPSVQVVGPDFVPYLTAGYWGYTAEGDWIWVSDYEWGWAVFHYGRWVWVPERGWAWIPGRAYAPAWVVWRVGYPGYDYVGWAPMPPSYYWYGGVAVSLWVVPPPYYVYCESRYVFTRHVHSHRLHGYRAHEAARHSRPHRPASPNATRDRHAARPQPAPSFEQARIPPDAVPRTPATPHPRATAAASSPASHRATSGAMSAAPRANAGPSSASARKEIGRPVYRGMPSGALPADRRAAPLASRPVQPSAPRRELRYPSRTLGSSTAPSQYDTRGSTAPSYPAGPRSVSPMPSGRSTYQPSTQPTRPGMAAPYPSRSGSARPSARPSYDTSAGRSSGPTRPTYDTPSRPSARPSYGAPSGRPSYGAPAPAPTGTGNKYGPSKGSGGGKGRGAPGRASPRGGRR